MRSIVIVLALALTAAAQPDLKQFGWISGCWESSMPNRTIAERWGPATADMMIGTSQTVRDGKTISYEFLRIAAGKKGPSYVARPSTAAAETEFRFVRSSGAEVVFENPRHDFPQRIIYKADGPDKLIARIEGVAGGKLRGTDFRMNRVKC